MKLRLQLFRRPALFLGAVLVALAVLAGWAAGGASYYPSPLHLSGVASSALGTSYRLVASAGVGATARPNPTATACTVVMCPGGVLTSGGSNYSYRYTLVDAGGETVPSAAATAGAVTNQQIIVGNLPTGVTVRLYRQKGSGLFNQVAELTNNASSTYADNLPDGSVGVLLPQAQTRTNLSGAGSATGWFDFQPGNAVTTTLTNGNFPNIPPGASPVFDGKGWIVDGAGSVAFPAGSWAFTTKVVTTGTSGTSHLVIGMWKVNDAGSVVGSPLIDPTCSSAPCGENTGPNISLASQTGSAIVSSFSLSTFSLLAGEHLYVQFFRHQTAAALFGSTISTLNVYDGVAQIAHPTASTFPDDPTLQTPADAAQTNSSTLVATFSDPDVGDIGTVDFRVCAAAASVGSQCWPLLASGSVAGVAAGANASWPISPALADGTYYWQAHATDAAGGQSQWTATHSFTLDTISPGTTISAGPASPTNATSASFSFSASEVGSSFQCQLDGAAYTPCTSPVVYTGLADSSHTFQVEATDPAGNTSASPASHSWTVDTKPPDTTISPGPASPTNATSASFSFTASEVGSSFQCQLDGGGYTACTSPVVYSGLSDGSHTFEVKATDLAGNTAPSPDSSTWTVDTIPPETTITAGPARLVSSSSAGFSFDASEADSSFQCQLDGGGFSACTSPTSYGGLADGSHSFQVEATDPAGNTDLTPAAQSWTVDTTPPSLPVLSRPQDRGRTSSPRLEATFWDRNQGGKGTLTFQLCSDPTCATVIASGASEPLENGFSASWAAPENLGDATYFWRARAEDPAGNRTAWTGAASFTLDRSPPGQPTLFGGSVGSDGLILRWAPPASDSPAAEYVLYVNGVRTLVLDGSSLKARLGRFDADDSRSFAVAAVDAAGNQGPRTESLSGVPDLVGLQLSEADAALEARGLTLGKWTLSAQSSALVVAQRPAAGTLAPTHSTVFVVLSSLSGRGGESTARAPSAPLIVHVGGTRTLSCAPSSRLTLHAALSQAADVSVRFLTVSGVPVSSSRLSKLPGGSQTVKVRLPSGPSERRRYRVIVTASTADQIVRAEFRLTILLPGVQTPKHTCG